MCFLIDTTYMTMQSHVRRTV